MSDSSRPLSIPQIEGAVVTLRSFAERDVHLIEEASLDEHIPLITTVPTEYSHEAGLAFVSRQHDRARTRSGYSFAIADRQTDEAVGQVGWWIADLQEGRATIGYWVGASRRGRGFATEAVELLSLWAFDNLPVQRLNLFVEPWNIASIKVAERAGFEAEGLLRRWELISDEPKDMVIFGRLRPSSA